MATELDPRGAEPEALAAATDLSNKRVLEVGAGDGRLTYRLPGHTRFVAGIDDDIGKLTEAHRTRPRNTPPDFAFLAADALALPFRAHAFDVVLMAWSL